MNSQFPLVSIITPCFNDGDFIEESVRSVLNSSYRNFELIVIDDGSTDHSLEVLSRIDDPRISIKTQKNSGVISARNNGLKSASGKYVLFLDSDDLISEGYISICVCALESDPDLQLVTCNYRLFGKVHKEILTSEFNMTKLLGRNLFVITSMFRREKYEVLGGFNQNMHDGLEDWDFWIKLLKGGGKVLNVPEIHFFYRIKTSSRNSSIDVTMHKKLRRQIWENHKEIFSEVFFDPQQTFEYERIAYSHEYKLGKLLLSPLRRLLNR